MKIYTNAPIYNYASGEDNFSYLTEEEKALKAKERQEKILERKKKRQQKKAEKTEKRLERKVIRQQKRNERKAKRQAKKLLRAKDKTGRKKWFYPISRVFKGKKKQKDGTIVDVDPKNILTTKSGVQFDKTEIATAIGVPEAQITAQMAEQVLVSTPQGSTTVSENTTLSPFVAKQEETNIDPNASVEQVLNNLTTIYAPVNDNKEVVTAEDGATYIADETTSQQEPPISDEEFNAMNKKSSLEEKKGLGVWAWVGISAIIVGLAVGGVLIYKMSKGKK